MKVNLAINMNWRKKRKNVEIGFTIMLNFTHVVLNLRATPSYIK